MKEGASIAERGKTNHLFDPVLSAPLNLGKFEVDFVQRVRLKCLQFFGFTNLLLLLRKLQVFERRWIGFVDVRI